MDYHFDTQCCAECGSENDVRETWIADVREEIEIDALPTNLCVVCRIGYEMPGFRVITTEPED